MNSLIENSIIMSFSQGICFFLTLLMSIRLLSQYKNRLKLTLGILLAYWTLLHIKDVIMGNNHLTSSDGIQNWIMMIDVLTVPLCAFFLFELIAPRYVTFRVVALNYFPFALLVISYCVSENPVLITITQIFSVIYGVVIMALTFWMVNKADKKLLSKTPCYLIISLMFVFLLSWVISCLDATALTDTAYYIVSTFLWLVIYYTIEYKYMIVISPIKSEEKRINIYGFSDALKLLIENDKIYLDPNLSVADVARQVGTNRNYLSQYFNHEYNMPFVDYINNLRVSYAEKLLVEDLSIEEIATSSGFNSVTTFRRAFTKKYGVTPSQYRHGYRLS